MAGSTAKRPAIKLVEPQDEPAAVYGRVEPPYWGTVAIVGGGPSLIDFDYERLRGATVLAVKRAIFNIPWADAGFGLGDWPDKLASVSSRIYWAVPDGRRTPAPENMTLLRRRDGQDVSDDPGEVYGGGTSGFGAFQIALHKRAKRIVLFGFDYEGDDRKWKIWAEHFRVYVPHLTASGASVVNACPWSAISCFQKATLDDGVAALH